MSSAIQHAQLTTKAVETTGDRPANVRSGEKWMRVISTARVADRDDEVIDTASLRIPIKPKGWKYARDLAATDTIDMGFFYDHQMAAEKQLGSVRSMFVNGDGELETVVAFTSLQRGQDAYTLAKEGHLGNSLSGTFSYRTASQDEAGVFYDMEMVELSLVFKGANQNARVLEVSKRFKGETMAEAKTLDELKAEEAAIQKQISDLEAQAQPEQPAVEVETPEEPAQPEVETPEPAPEAPVAEEEPEVPAPAETPAEPVEVEEHPPQSKSIKQEQPNMNDVVVKQVKDAPTPEAPASVAEKGMDKIDFTAKQFVAWVNGDSKTLSELNAKAIESHKDLTSKATYMNTGVVADGGAIVPNAELLADIYTTLKDFSTVAGDLRVITLNEGNSIDYASLLTDVIMTEVGSEGGNKAVTKPVLAKGNVALREFAGIALITKKLVRQASVSVYDLLRESFARAIANQRAVLALTDSTSGITHVSGTVTVTAAATHTTVDKVTYADIRKMPYAITASTVQGAKYYISRELLAALDSGVDTTGRDLDILTLNGDGLSGRFKNGFEFVVEDVLGKSGEPHAVFGAMGRYGFLLRQGVVESETFDTGSVTDGSSVVHNLLQQNKLAQRVAFYENVGYPVPSAFAKLALASS